MFRTANCVSFAVKQVLIERRRSLCVLLKGAVLIRAICYQCVTKGSNASVFRFHYIAQMKPNAGKTTTFLTSGIHPSLPPYVWSNVRQKGPSPISNQTSLLQSITLFQQQFEPSSTPLPPRTWLQLSFPSLVKTPCTFYFFHLASCNLDY